MDCQECKPLIAGLLDHELTTEESSMINEHLIRCDNCRKEYEELSKTGSLLKTITFKEPEDEVMENVWRSPFSNFTKWSGVFLVIAGYLLFIGYSLYQFIVIKDEGVLQKIALVAITTGFLILLFSVIRLRIKTYKTDRYKEIVR